MFFSYFRLIFFSFLGRVRKVREESNGYDETLSLFVFSSPSSSSYLRFSFFFLLLLSLILSAWVNAGGLSLPLGCLDAPRGVLTQPKLWHESGCSGKCMKVAKCICEVW